MKTKPHLSYKQMWEVIGLQGSPNNDRNLYCSFDQADSHAPTPSFIKKCDVIKLNY